MKLRRITAFLLSIATAVAVAGCSGDTTSSESKDSNSEGGSTTSSVTSDVNSVDNNNNNNNTSSQTLFEFSQVAMGGGGFVSGVFATKEEGLYYARTDVGGAYRYDKTLDKWVCISYDISEDDRGLLGIDGLAFAEDAPNKLYLLSGTEYFSNGKSCLLISDDYGKSFTRTELTDLIKVHGNGMGRGNGERIAVDPKNSDIIYIGGRTGGMIKSTDGGKTFTALDMGTKTETTNGNGICCIVIDSASGDIYAAISRKNEDNLYKSSDGGNSWTAVAGAPQSMMVQRMKWNGDGKLLIVYASEEGPWNNDRVNGGIMLYDPATGTFTDISPAKKCFGDVVVHPEDANKMVACTENLYVPQPNGAYGDEFYVTTDGGKSWKLLNNSMTMTDGGMQWITSSSIHWCSSMCIDPNAPDKIKVVSGNGIFASDNIWSDKPEFYFNAKGIEETVPYELVSIVDGPLVTVIGDYDGFCQPDAKTYGNVHNSIAGSMTSLAVARKNPDVWVKCGGDETKPGFWYTEDAGKTWKNIKTSPLETRKIAYKGAVGVSADGKTFYWAPENGMGFIYFTSDKGKTWTKSEGGMATEFISADPVNPDYVYATSSGNFYMSSDGGKTFKPNHQLSVFTATRPIVTPDTEGRIYYAAMGLQISDDHGETFTRVDTVSACLSVGIGKGKDENSPYVIYIWGKPKGEEELGLYWSEDEGKTWSRINDAEHQFGGPGNGGFVHGDFNTYGRVYMSTVGLGVVYGDYKG